MVLLLDPIKEQDLQPEHHPVKDNPNPNPTPQDRSPLEPIKTGNVS